MRAGDVTSAPRRTEGSVVVVEPGEPAGQPVGGDLELGVQVDELADPLRQPGQADLLLTAPLRELVDAPVGAVHG